MAEHTRRHPPGAHRQPPLRRALLLVLAAGLGVVAWLVLRPPALPFRAGLPAPTPSPTAPPPFDFTVQDIDGNEARLSDYRGQVVLVNFWATWCAPCKEEMPLLDAYYQEHRDAGFVVLGVNVSDRPNDAAAFFEEAGYSFPLVFDPPGNVLVELGARGLPVSLLVDAEGGIHERWVGPLTREMLDEGVTPLLAAQGQEG